MKVIKEIYDYRQMIFSLVKKDIRGRYKGSVLGFLWTFINPLLQLVIYTVVFSTILRAGIDKFYLFLFVALVPWIFFQTSISGGSSSIISHSDLIKKIYFPREVIPIAYVTSCFVNMLLCFIVIFVVVLFSGVNLDIVGILCLPIIMLVEYVMALGMALIASAVTVYFKDLEHILGIFTMAWMYLTPIMYSVDMVPDNLQIITKINPMTPIITAYRDVLYYGRIPHINTLFSGFVLGIIILVSGFIVFGRLKRHFAEEL